MKNDLLLSLQLQSNLQLEELTLSEEIITNGGESLWYWITYGVVNALIAGASGPSEYDRIRRETGFGK